MTSQDKQLQHSDVPKALAYLKHRSAYRAGQRDMLMKIKSIVDSYCLGEEEQMKREILAYCQTYIPETALDKQITDESIKRLE